MVKGDYPTGGIYDRPQDISSSISWSYLQNLRRDADFESSTGYAYSTIGSDAIVDRWIDYGIEKKLLDGFWRCELEQLVTMERAAANKLLMGQLRFDQL